ncbi:MAG: GNAT family N-acetyltransferase [Pseudomonadales bacterium]|jgi:ribosomal protein S18 acetylase RimI-like enzyme|nr:GNAT family N-acetyltransferase [Pseudomonadales bacterium]
MRDARIRPATPDDLDAMCALLPRLAEFELPAGRAAEDLWKGDAQTLARWAAGEEPDCIVLVAEDETHGVVGLALVRLQPEFMSRDPSAHLEAIAIATVADGQGLGRRLLRAAEDAAEESGARSMTLHVFVNNERARSVYDRHGYAGELMRYVKRFEED